MRRGITQAYAALNCVWLSFLDTISKSHDLRSCCQRCDLSPKHPRQPHAHPKGPDLGVFPVRVDSDSPTGHWKLWSVKDYVLILWE